MRSLGGILGDKVKTGTSLTMEVKESDSALVIPPGKGTDCKEVYFVGCHSGEYSHQHLAISALLSLLRSSSSIILLLDVGGGSVPNHTKWSLQNIPLRWMIKEILEAEPGIIFRDDPRLADMGIYLNTQAGAEIQGEDRRARAYAGDARGPEGVTTVVGPEPPESDDNPSSYMPVDARPQDVTARINDKLKNPLWWLLEFYPFVTGYQDEQDVWHNRLRYVLYLYSSLFIRARLYNVSSLHALGSFSRFGIPNDPLPLSVLLSPHINAPSSVSISSVAGISSLHRHHSIQTAKNPPILEAQTFPLHQHCFMSP